MKNVKRRDLLQTVAMASSTLALPGCAEGDLDHDLGVSVQGLVVHPRAYVTTHTLNPGGTLQWCASYGSSAGMARLRIMRVASMSSATSPQTDTPLVVNRNVSLSAATAPYNGDEVGYGWPITNEVLPTDIEPGLYAAQWSGDGVTWDGATVAYFVVRPVSGVGDILLCMPFSTTLAYAGAPWGQHVNLYDSFQWGRGRRVSMDRPWDQSDKPERTVRYPLQLYNFIRAMPGAPNVDLCTSFDLHENGSLLSGYKLFISAGHDEYWSKEMRDAVEAFVAAGGNAAFFSANTAWWQVRFSGRTMICHKSGVEDQFAGVDDARVTANSSACPTNRPENTLTGVSYRRGVAFPSTPLPFTIVATGHPYFADVAGTTFGSSALLSYETDAVEYGAGFVPTGRDGSPTNLEVLAYADMSADDGGSQKGQATMTRFTNNGVVFSAATTEWCDQLGDPKVAQITRNVIDALKTTSTNATWTLPARSNPGAAWETLDSAVGAGVALVGVVQGSLLAYGGNFRQRDPETPSVAWSSTSIPALAGLKSLASDLWGKFLYAGTSGGTVFRRSSRAGNAAAWGQAVAPPRGRGFVPGSGRTHRGNLRVIRRFRRHVIQTDWPVADW